MSGSGSYAKDPISLQEKNPTPLTQAQTTLILAWVLEQKCQTQMSWKNYILESLPWTNPGGASDHLFSHLLFSRALDYIFPSLFYGTLTDVLISIQTGGGGSNIVNKIHRLQV